MLFSQQDATIQGVVRDGETDEPLPGVNVIIKGTYYGAASASDGKYIITGISPGSYDIEISMVGYKVLLKTGVEVKAEAVVTENFAEIGRASCRERV